MRSRYLRRTHRHSVLVFRLELSLPSLRESLNQHHRFGKDVCQFADSGVPDLLKSGDDYDPWTCWPSIRRRRLVPRSCTG